MFSQIFDHTNQKTLSSDALALTLSLLVWLCVCSFAADYGLKHDDIIVTIITMHIKCSTCSITTKKDVNTIELYNLIACRKNAKYSQTKKNWNSILPTHKSVALEFHNFLQFISIEFRLLCTDSLCLYTDSQLHTMNCLHSHERNFNVKLTVPFNNNWVEIMRNLKKNEGKMLQYFMPTLKVSK